MASLSIPGSDSGHDYDGFHSDIVTLLDAARRAAARSVNAVMTATYWDIGRRIVEFEQGGSDRATYGDALIRRLGADLSQQFGRGFGWRNLAQMRAFYLAWAPGRIVQTPSALSGLTSVATPTFPLSWSAYVRLLSVKNEAARHFYETEALRCGWSVRQLDRQINSQFHERLALSHNKAALLRKGEAAEPGDVLTPEQAIRDPFVLEFLDLKVGRFSHADAGQMHMSLNYAREHWMKPGENPPVGLILCSVKGADEARYALEGLPNQVLAAEYQMVLPDEKLLAEELARTRLALEIKTETKPASS